MIMDVKKQILKNKEGVAFFEFIFFLPMMVILMGLLVSIGNSINGAINQQKITRSYFYARISNDSTFPKKSQESGGIQSNQSEWSLFGLYFIGWREKLDGQLPLQPCFKFRLPIENEEQECSEYSKDTTNFVRIGTVYGACGATYQRIGSSTSHVKAPAPGSLDTTIATKYDGCTIRQ